MIVSGLYELKPAGRSLLDQLVINMYDIAFNPRLTDPDTSINP